MAARLRGERGSALVEAAIVFPCLLLVVLWSIALTDVLVLKLKASEAARFALWETTVWKAPGKIEQEIRERFTDARSPSTIRNTWTGLLAYPRAAGLRWRAAVDTTSDEVGLAGQRIDVKVAPGIIRGFVERASGWIAGAVQAAMQSERFNTHGVATVRVRLEASRAGSKLLGGGDLLGRRGGNDLGAPRALANLVLEAPARSQRPMRLVFDTWKAWPRPPAYELSGGPADPAASPKQSYPEVEKQVAAQLAHVAFFGMKKLPWFGALDSVVARIAGSGIGSALLGGRPPSIFSTERMDSPKRGPITIRPIQPATASFAANVCDTRSGRQQPCTSAGQGVQRVGDVESNTPVALAGLDAYTEDEDATRYTVPYQINSRYWLSPGGTGGGFWSNPGMTLNVAPLPRSIARDNAYAVAWNCRGYFFAGGIGAQRTSQRYRPPCG
ncbi:MAG TPA: TadE family protein [Myxococcales bacterium]|nr:TadE family protein [Myxococcales bacterium]